MTTFNRGKDRPSLLEYAPELASQWHPTKNGSLTPDQVPYNSAKKVWWSLTYHDERTGREFPFEWEATIYSRNILGSGCPFLHGALWPGFNDLETLEPEIASEWNYARNGDLRPNMITPGSSAKVWWITIYRDPGTGQETTLEWKAAVYSRAKLHRKCPYLTGTLLPGFNDLETVRPDIAMYWHPMKNGPLTPRDVTMRSGRHVWWLYPYVDSRTGQTFAFEWIAPVIRIVNTQGALNCPYLSNTAVWYGFNDLESQWARIAREWHLDKNLGVKPSEVYAYSTNHYHWKCSECGHEWVTTVINRTRYGTGCPRCHGRHRSS